MNLSTKYAVPPHLALLYDFVNSLDERSYVENGGRLQGGDEFATTPNFARWLDSHGFQSDNFETDRQRAIMLRDAMRMFLRVPPEQRRGSEVAYALQEELNEIPLIIQINDGQFDLIPWRDNLLLGTAVAQLHRLGIMGELGRLKMCSSEECNWIFFDRSKPGTRTWCSADGCGNRHKTRAYRARKKTGGT